MSAATIEDYLVCLDFEPLGETEDGTATRWHQPGYPLVITVPKTAAKKDLARILYYAGAADYRDDLKRAGDELPKPAIATPPKCADGTDACEAARIHAVHRAAFFKTLRELKFRDAAIDLLFLLEYDHVGEEGTHSDLHLFRARNRALSPVTILLPPHASLEHVREAIYQAGRRDMRGEIAPHWQQLTRWLGSKP